MILAYIDEHKDRCGVEPICRLLSQHGVTIAYYARRAQPATSAEIENAYAANTLIDLHRDNRGVHGARKCWHALRRAGHHLGRDLGRDQVARLMRMAGIDGIRRGKHRTVTTQRDEKAPRHYGLVYADFPGAGLVQSIVHTNPTVSPATRIVDRNSDGRSDLSVWRPSDGTWYVISSTVKDADTSPAQVRQWGTRGDIAFH